MKNPQPDLLSEVLKTGCVWLSLFLFGQWVMLAVFLKVIGAW